MKHVPLVWIVLPVAAVLLVAVVLTADTANAQSGAGQMPESRQMQRETYLGKDMTLKTPCIGSVTVGYASRKDYENGTRPTSPTVMLLPGASITHTLTVTNRSKVLIQGGRIGYRERNSYGGEVMTGDTASVVFSGGTAYTLSATGHSTITVTGGTIGYSVLVGENGTVNVKGGTLKGEFIVGPGGTLNVFGTNLNKRLLKPGEAGYADTRAEQEDAFVLSGMLGDGTALTGKILRVGKESGSKINFINAPPTKAPGRP